MMIHEWFCAESLAMINPIRELSPSMLISRLEQESSSLLGLIIFRDILIDQYRKSKKTWDLEDDLESINRRCRQNARSFS